TMAWSKPMPRWRSPSQRHCAAVIGSPDAGASSTMTSLPAPCILVNSNCIGQGYRSAGISEARLQFRRHAPAHRQGFGKAAHVGHVAAVGEPFHAGEVVAVDQRAAVHAQEAPAEFGLELAQRVLHQVLAAGVANGGVLL